MDRASSLLFAGAAAGLLLFGASALAQPASQLAVAGAFPAALKPRHVAGLGLNVNDLEAQKTWYTSRLGMSVVMTVPAGGPPYEYILGLEDGLGRAVLVLTKSGRAGGANTFSRLILEVADAKALADHLSGQGVQSREVVRNVAYFIRDPEGNPIELYSPPKR